MFATKEFNKRKGGWKMKKSIGLLAFCLAVFAPVAGAYEYPLQFSPNAGYRSLVVAGYYFSGTNIVGNCSYYTTSGGSGKGGGGGSTTTVYNQTCTWDAHGNLLSVAHGAPVVPHPLYSNETQVVYAVNANGDITGTDIKMPERGFVSTPGSHYTWLTRMTQVTLHPGVYTISVTLESDGDSGVNISAVTPSSVHGVATLHSTTCIGDIPVRGKCSITVTYDVSKVTLVNGVAIDTFRIDLTSDAEASQDFIENFRIAQHTSGPPRG